MRLLLVDDDPGLRALLRTTFEVIDVELDEAEDAGEAAAAIRERRPDVVVLDVGMPGIDGLAFCRSLKDEAATRQIPVVLLTGAEAGTERAAREAGADAFVRKPFSPLQLLALVERLGGAPMAEPLAGSAAPADEQLLLYARDLRQLVEIERTQRLLLQSAYRETVAALASALESKDTGTRAHSQRVQRYAVRLASTVAPALASDESTEYGFLLHDVGKIGIPDRILQKPAALSDAERRLMKMHTILGEQVLSGVAFLHAEAIKVVRSHHERWDGKGYPDGLRGEESPMGARIFSLADALDAMTSDRPYRKALPWRAASAEIVAERGRQFDPDVVDAFRATEAALEEIRREFAPAA